MKKAIRSFILVLFISIVSYFAYSAGYNDQVNKQDRNVILASNNKNEIILNNNVNNVKIEKEKIEKTEKEETKNNGTNLKFVIGDGFKKYTNNADLLNYIVEIVKNGYVEEVKEDEMYENAIKGLMSSLDPHSMYMNKKEFQEMQLQTKGEFGGLGIVVTKDSNFIKVVSPIEGTPAFKAGILTGDYISEINGESTFDMSLYDAVEKMRGKIGERIKLVVLRKGENEPLNFTLRKEIIKIDSVSGSIKDDNILYIKITSFIETTQRDIINLFNRLRGTLKDNNEIKGIILDLRNNPGGLLDQSVKVSELFLDENKTVVSIREKDNKLWQDYKTRGNKLLKYNVPMVVLVNEGSASASEIVSGALQDHKVAIIMGEKTFGKASVQQVFPLSNGGAIKMTIARYYTPLGRSIQLEGIVPDIIVKNGEVLFDKKDRPDIKEENLKGHLEKEDNNNDIVTKTIKKEMQNKKNNNIETNITDYQLLRAIDLINSINFYKNDNEQNK